jgi:hypothetical protein
VDGMRAVIVGIWRRRAAGICCCVHTAGRGRQADSAYHCLPRGPPQDGMHSLGGARHTHAAGLGHCLGIPSELLLIRPCPFLCHLCLGSFSSPTPLAQCVCPSEQLNKTGRLLYLPATHRGPCLTHNDANDILVMIVGIMEC